MVNFTEYTLEKNCIQGHSSKNSSDILNAHFAFNSKLHEMQSYYSRF